jgi:hypothetical protein
VADLASIASLATAGGTLVLAIATFASVRSGNRSARVAERSLLAGLRPVLAPSRLQDPEQKITWSDGHWTRLTGGTLAAELDDGVVYLSMALRNVGSGMAVLHGWMPFGERADLEIPRSDPETMRRQGLDLYVPSGDIGFWQGALRDPSEPLFGAVRSAIEGRRAISVDLLYGDHEGGQRTISRFNASPSGHSDAWLASVVRHWNLDREDPR